MIKTIKLYMWTVKELQRIKYQRTQKKNVYTFISSLYAGVTFTRFLKEYDLLIHKVGGVK